MGLDFTLYEVTNYNDVEIHDEHIVKEVLQLTNTEAMLITEWFYKEDTRLLQDNINESHNYITCSGERIIDIIKTLERIINCDDKVLKNLLALNYFPTVYNSSYYIASLPIFTEEYYTKLDNILQKLKKIIPVESIENNERLFLYNISW